MELNREQIKKALECCIEGDYCATCPATDYCGDVDNLIANALTLIKKLTEENATLHASCTELTRVQEENERLQKALNSQFDSYEGIRKKAKADTVRKMQKALEHRIHSKLSYHGWYLKETVIAEIAKEMLEGV